jgi:hypothetical protein
MPSMQPQPVDLTRLIDADKMGRTRWNWRASNEDGPVNIDPHAFRNGGYLPRAILAEDNDLHAQWRANYMLTAYPRSGRNRCRGN